MVLGFFVHTTAVGVAVIFKTSQYAFSALKYAGAAYLLYLAWQALTASQGNFEGDKSKSKTAPKQSLCGFILCIVNLKQKSFLAFLPQFVVSGNGSVIAQFNQLGALMFCVTLLVFGAVAIAAGALGTWIKGSVKTQIWLNKISGIVFVSLAVKLVATKK